MSRTYRKHPHGVDLHPHPARDGIAWSLSPTDKRFVKRATNRAIRRAWLNGAEIRAMRAVQVRPWY